MRKKYNIVISSMESKLKHARMLHYLWYFADKNLSDESISGIQISVVTKTRPIITTHYETLQLVCKTWPSYFQQACELKHVPTLTIFPEECFGETTLKLYQVISHSSQISQTIPFKKKKGYLKRY